MQPCVVLDLTHFCIQTAARREHNRLANLLLESAEASETLAAQISLLADFLERGDFPRLRAEHPELAGGTPCRVELTRSPGGEPRWRIAAQEPAGRDGR